MAHTQSIKKSLVSLLGEFKKPLSVSEILETIPANKTTIYRNLYELLNDQVVAELDFGDGTKRYETVNLGHHHHLVCTNCKRIEEVEIGDKLMRQEKQLEKKTGFKSIKHNLEFFGLCSTCSKV